MEEKINKMRTECTVISAISAVVRDENDEQGGEKNVRLSLLKVQL